MVEQAGKPLDIRKLHGTVAELAGQLQFVNEKVVQYRSEVLTEHGAGHLRRVAAASLIRVPNCLDAVLRLADAKLGLEAHTIVRTIVELAITLCWVGLDEKRAQAVWDKSVNDFSKGISRARNHSPVPKEIDEWVSELRATHSGTKRPSLERMAEEAIDIDALPGRTMAKRLYDFLYDPLSAASHGDLRFAKLVLNGADALFVPSALDYAAGATDFLLIAASAQLGFQADLGKFLQTNSQREASS
jgi:hypothetical protein